MERRFERDTGSLASIYDFLESFASDAGVDHQTMLEINLAIEELFTNMVKYSTETKLPIEIDLSTSDGCVVVTMVDQQVDAFDVTRADADDMEAALEQKATGGRGLFLVKQVMDSIAYEYDESRRSSRITMKKALE